MRSRVVCIDQQEEKSITSPLIAWYTHFLNVMFTVRLLSTHVQYLPLTNAELHTFCVYRWLGLESGSMRLFNFGKVGCSQLLEDAHKEEIFFLTFYFYNYRVL